jgi:rubrerythrin
MHEITAGNLRSAFSGESMAHMRYKVWAEKADLDGFPNVGRLFRAISRAEQAHASGHFRALRSVGGASDVSAAGGFGLAGTSANLQGAIDGELFEVREMYPAYLAVAQMQGEKMATRSMTFAVQAEKIHADMYARAKAAVDAGSDVELGPVRICPICGHTIEGDVPDRCPICNAKGELYVTFA